MASSLRLTGFKERAAIVDQGLRGSLGHLIYFLTDDIKGETCYRFVLTFVNTVQLLRTSRDISIEQTADGLVAGVCVTA